MVKKYYISNNLCYMSWLKLEAINFSIKYWISSTFIMALVESGILNVGTDVSAKYKGAFCEAKIRSISKIVKCRVQYSDGTSTLVLDEAIIGPIEVGASVEVKSLNNKELIPATIKKIQDCSLYTVVFDDGDITSLKRSALCLKKTKHFSTSEQDDNTEHSIQNNVIIGRRSLKYKQLLGESEKKVLETDNIMDQIDIGKVICVETHDKKKIKDNWFPGLIVSFNVQSVIKTNVTEDYLVRSFKDGKYYTVPKKEITIFTKDIAAKVDSPTLKTAVEKAISYIDKDELPPHWDRDFLLGVEKNNSATDNEELCSDNSDDESIEEKDHFVAQLFKFMDDRGSPINGIPVINDQPVDLYKLFKVVNNFGGFNKVDRNKLWKLVANKIGYEQSMFHVKQSYQQYLHSFEDFYRKLGCTMLSHPKGFRSRSRFSRSIIRDIDKSTLNTLSTTVEKNKSPPLVKENENLDQLKKSVKVLKNDEKVICTKNNDNLSKKADSNIMARSRPSVKLKSDILETEDVKIKKETITEQKVKKTVRNTFGKSVQKNIKIEKIPKVKPPDNFQPVVKKMKKMKSQLKNFIKVITPFKKSKNSSSINELNNKFKPDDEEIPKFTRSKSKEDILTKEKLSKLTDQTSDNSLLKEPISSAILDNSSKIKKSDKNDKKKSIPKIKDKEILNELSSTPMCQEDIKLEKNLDDVLIGDDLMVHYGNDLTTSYEAKVLKIDVVTGGYKFFVHYKGWNSRYDEWISDAHVTKCKKVDYFNDTEDLSKDQKNILKKKLPMNNKTKKSNISSSLCQKKSPFSNTRPIRLCTLNNDQVSSVGKYTIKENSDSESEYTGKLCYEKQFIKTEQTLKPIKIEHETIIKKDNIEKESSNPMTYSCKEMISEHNVPKKLKSCVFKVHSNKSEEIEICEQVTLKPPKDFNFEMHTPQSGVLQNSDNSIIEDDINMKTQNKPVYVTKKNSEATSTNYVSHKDKSKSNLDDCKDNHTNLELLTLPKHSKNINTYYQSTEDEEKLDMNYKFNQQINLPLDKKPESKISSIDFDLNKIRSEMKGFISHTETSNPESFIKDRKTETNFSKTIKPDTEDIYEFKEIDTDPKIIPSAIEENHINLPNLYNFEKADSLSKVRKFTSNMEIVKETESKLSFDCNTNTTNPCDSEIKKHNYKKNMIMTSLTEDVISPNQKNDQTNLIIDSIHANKIENCQNTENLDNKVKILDVLDSHENNMFSMSESEETVDTMIEDHNKITSDCQTDANLLIVEDEYNFSYKKSTDIQSKSQPLKIHQLSNADTGFESLNDIKNNYTLPNNLDTKNTITDTEDIQNQHFQIYSHFTSKPTKLTDQSNNNECNTNSNVEINVESSTSISTNNDKLMNNFESGDNKDDENIKQIPELQCKEDIFEDDNANSVNDLNDSCNNLELNIHQSNKDLLPNTSAICDAKNYSLETRQAIFNFDINAPSTSQHLYEDNNIKNNINYENSPSTSKHSYSSPETNLNSVLFCEESLPGSPTNTLDEHFEQAEKKNSITQNLYEEQHDASSMYNMHQSFRKPLITLMGATEEEMVQYTHILQNDGILNQKHLKFLADISTKHFDMNAQKVIETPESKSEIVAEKRKPDKPQKRKTSYEYPIAKRNKIFVTNSNTEMTIEKPNEISTPLKDYTQLVFFTPDMNNFQRQGVILAKMNDLRKEYIIVKNRVSVIDKRRKKIKKRKRELAKVTSINQNKQSLAVSIAK